MFIFITSRDHFRLRLEMAIDDLYMQSSADIFFYFEDNADGSQAPHVAAAEAPEEIHGKRGSVELGT